jgi:hypothetical protein
MNPYRKSRFVLLALLLFPACASSVSSPPLPNINDLRPSISPPPRDIPEHVAAFSGVWAGRWAKGWNANGEYSVAHYHTLVVERIVDIGGGRYRAEVIYSTGLRGQAWRQDGIITPDGALHLDFRSVGRKQVYTMSLNRETLSTEAEGLDSTDTAPGSTMHRWTGTLFRSQLR